MRLVSLILVSGITIIGCQKSAAAPQPTQQVEQAMYTKPSDEQLRKTLTPMQYEVTQHDATEPPFRNDYWNNHEPGLYVDVVTGQPLFSSTDKFESGTGWPSFTKPVDPAAVKTKSDGTLGMERTEVRSAIGDSHLGHVFDDGPEPGGLRYCMNSASLRFIPVSKLAASGYGAYAHLFDGSPHEVAAATTNACAAPPPGTIAGCATTLETAIVSADSIASIEKMKGVLQVDLGTFHGAKAARVTYDPKAVTLPRVLKLGDDKEFVAK